MISTPLPSHLREFDDTDKARELIYSGALDAVSKRFPVEDDEYRIELHKPHYTGVQTYSLEQQKQALMKERRLTTPITGTWKLVHKPTGATLDEREDVVMNVPYYTQRGTFVHGGNEYSVVNQARLRPGVYIRRQRTGEIEGHVNVKSGTGKPFRVQLEPNTGVFKIHVGQSNVPLYPLLRTLGITDQQLIKAWGADLVAANIKKQDPRSIAKLYDRFAGYKAEPGIDEAGQTKYLRDSLPLFELDEDVNARTLGLTGAKGVTPDVLLRMTSKMLGVSRGEEDPDDRDSPQFSHIYGVEDLIRERIDKDAGKLTQSMLRKVRRSRNLQTVRRGALNSYLDSLLMGSGLAMPLEETNPLHTLEQLNRITKLGEGGIGSAEAITDEARDVNPGQFGFVDPITGPEGMNIGIDVRSAYRTFKGNDNNMYAEFNDIGTGKPVYLRPDEAASRVVAFPGQDPKASTLYAMRRGKVERVPREEVDLAVPSFAHMMSSHTNLNPMPTAVQAGRQFYGAKFWSQYMPQVQGEVPLVDSLMPDGKMTWTEYYGRKVGTLKSDVGGTVVKVTDKGVTVMDADGKKHLNELVKDFPFNRLTGISYFPTVKVGDQINVGDMVAHSNFTDSKTGALNLGRNLRTAIIPYRGHSYEDAYVISKTAADKLASERLQGFDLDARHGVEMGRNKYISAFPRTYTTDQIDNLDDDGVVKPGTVLRKGDPIALAVGPRLLTSADAQLGKLHKVLRSAFTDKSLTWDYSSPGTVTDVALTRNGLRVNIKSTPPVSQGDKLSTRFGLKGVVGTILDDDKMPRDPATNQPYELLLNPMAVLSRVAPNQIMEMALGKIAAKTGKQIRIPQEPPPEGWMNWVQAQLDAAGITDSSDIFDPESGKTIRNIGDGSVYVSAFHHLAEKKLSSRGDIGSYTADEQPARGGGTGAKKFCFAAEQPLRVLGGEEMIGHIVEKRLPALVWAPDASDNWGYRRITNWFRRRGNADELLSLTVSHLPCAPVTGSKRVAYGEKVLRITKNHEVYVPSGSKVRAGTLKAGDWVTTYGYVPTADQRDLLMGSMLGDGAICGLADPATMFYSEMHSPKQDNYVRWKHEMLAGIASNRTFTAKKTWYDGTVKRVGYVTVHRPDVVQELAQRFYRDGKKIVPELEYLTGRAAAVLFLDDGSCGIYGKHKTVQGSIAVMGFDRPDVERLAAVLSRLLDTQCTVTEARAIYLSEQACIRLARLVAMYVPVAAIPVSKRWLVDWVTAHPMYQGFENRPMLGCVPARVCAVVPYVDPAPSADGTLWLYDIEVEGVHRYCASDVVVSNSQMDVNAALAHGATDVIKDVITIRGTKNEEFWKALKLGRPLPEPKVPFIYDKFLNTLRAGGINVVEKGDMTQLLPMMDDDVKQLSKGVVSSSDMVDSDFEPMAGGLFDVGRTGGMAGNRWTHIELPEPLPNPVMEEPIRRLLGLKIQDMEDIVAGRKELNGQTGGGALKTALEKVDLDAMIAEHRQKVRTLRGANRDNSVKVLGYLASAKEQGIHPSKWIISKVPVLPPVFRPISRMGDVALSADLNELYRDVLESSKTFKELKPDLPDSELADERLNIYNAVRAAYGFGDSITPEGRSKRLKGAVRQVIGTSPKFGLFQSKVISKPVDVVGRGVVIPNPNLDMDQLGIPADSAWTLYKDFVMRALVRHGYPAIRAAEMLESRTPEAKEMLEKEMSTRPVIMDRAPTWHKFNLLAFYPHVVEGHTIQVSPLVTKGFNMDFDGDQANFHVPVSDKAVSQATRKMLPSANLFSLTDLQSVRHAPSMEMTYGLYQLTRAHSKKQARVFKTAKEARAAYKAGEIAANDPIEILT